MVDSETPRSTGRSATFQNVEMGLCACNLVGLNAAVLSGRVGRSIQIHRRARGQDGFA